MSIQSSRRISCLMITQPRRTELACDAVRDFAAQTWPNRELVVITDSDPARRYADTLTRLAADLGVGDHVRVIVVAPVKTLGSLRTIAMRFASGELMAQWDDDDRYHPTRLERQEAELDLGVACSCLTSQLYYFVNEKRLHVIDWVKRGARSHLIPGTVLAAAHLARMAGYPESGAQASKGEDSYHLDRLSKRGEARAISGVPWLYLRRFHGANTWSGGRFNANCRVLGWSRARLESSRDELEAAAVTYQLGPTAVHGSDGFAFEIGGTA
jgi:glycosyltransferase involved in cell wall biosynthesis